jgi:lipopolysaccharide biosynthesis glycosyltransferase
LDGDILVLKDLKTLYNTPFDGKVVVMARDNALPTYSFYTFEYPYFNSGMMLMDLKVWRKQEISKKLLSYLNNNMDKFTPKDDPTTYYNYPASSSHYHKMIDLDL